MIIVQKRNILEQKVNICHNELKDTYYIVYVNTKNPNEVITANKLTEIYDSLGVDNQPNFADKDFSRTLCTNCEIDEDIKGIHLMKIPNDKCLRNNLGNLHKTLHNMLDSHYNN